MQDTSTFEAGANSWNLEDDAFLFTHEPDYSYGRHLTDRGVDGGCLYLRLGGRNNSDVQHMSGAWTTQFDLDAAQEVTVTFWYQMNASGTYEPDEFSDVRFAIDGEAIGTGGLDYIARFYGDGNSGDLMTTGWQEVTLDLGVLAAGEHRIDLGGYLNKKTSASEVTRFFFDNVTVATTPTEALGDFEAEVLALTNAFRADNGKAALRADAKLIAAAEDWSRTMAEDDFFGHSKPEQVEKFGYEWSNWGENIAAGYTTPEAVVQGWIDSPGHRANMLSDSFAEIGIGHVYLADDRGDTNYHHYWTQAFGTEQGDTLI